MYIGPAYVISYAIVLVYVWLCVHPNMAYDHLLRNSTTNVSRMQRKLDATSPAHALLGARKCHVKKNFGLMYTEITVLQGNELANL